MAKPNWQDLSHKADHMTMPLDVGRVVRGLVEECERLEAAMPAYHDRPTVPGRYIAFFNRTRIRDYVFDKECIDSFPPMPTDWRYYGPIPTDAKAVKP